MNKINNIVRIFSEISTECLLSCVEIKRSIAHSYGLRTTNLLSNSENCVNMYLTQNDH